MATKFSVDCSRDLSLSGLVIGKQKDNVTYTSKKTGLSVEASRDVVILQSSFGFVICRSFTSDPAVSKAVETIAVGDNISLPVTSYSIENGLKTATVRFV